MLFFGVDGQKGSLRIAESLYSISFTDYEGKKTQICFYCSSKITKKKGFKKEIDLII
jgi:hypothetical protein